MNIWPRRPKHLELEESNLDTAIVKKEYKKKAKKVQGRRKTFGVKKKNELKKTKSRKKERLELKEGSTFESRIAVTEEEKL